MDYDFETISQSLRIPASAYKAAIRCRYCQSVYINENVCESCGRSMRYHPIGEPFSPKSFYGIKERYIESFQPFHRFFPQFENKQSAEAKSYVRKLSKRFSDLISAFNSSEFFQAEQRQFFYIESMELIDELLRYETHPQILESLLEENDNSLVGQELIHYLQGSANQIKGDRPWLENFLKHRLWGLIRVDFCLKTVIVTATVSAMAIKYKDIISSQFGR